MDREELLRRLKECREKYGNDPEAAHSRADEALLEYINDSEVTAAYEAITMWYA